MGQSSSWGPYYGRVADRYPLAAAGAFLVMAPAYQATYLVTHQTCSGSYADAWVLVGPLQPYGSEAECFLAYVACCMVASLGTCYTACPGTDCQVNTVTYYWACLVAACDPQLEACFQAYHEPCLPSLNSSLLVLLILEPLQFLHHVATTTQHSHFLLHTTKNTVHSCGWHLHIITHIIYNVLLPTKCLIMKEPLHCWRAHLSFYANFIKKKPLKLQ